MKIKLLTFSAISFLGVALFFLLPSFSTDDVQEQTDPLQQIIECCECCSPDSEGEGSEDCAWVENWDNCNALSEFIIDDLWRMQKTKIPVLRGSSGSQLTSNSNKPSGIKHRFSTPILQLPTTKAVEMIVGVAMTPAFKSYTVGGKLKGVKISIEFLDAKGTVISKTGQKPMTSVVLDKKSKQITQSVDQRSSFATISSNEIAYFKATPNFNSLEVQGIQTGSVLVKIFAKDKSGKFQTISTTKSFVRYADSNGLKKLINRR